MRNKVVYVSGKYSGDIEHNIQVARRYAIKLWEIGFTVFCPHLNTQHFEKDCDISYEDYIAGDLEIVRRCDAIFMLPGWIGSKGAIQERLEASRQGIPIFHFHKLEDLVKWGVSS